jgi:hypothetical protein
MALQSNVEKLLNVGQGWWSIGLLVFWVDILPDPVQNTYTQNKKYTL